MRRTGLLLSLVACALAAAAPTASADETVAVTLGTKVVADGGMAAWLDDEGALVVRRGAVAPRVTTRKLTGGHDLDLGRRPGGGARLAYVHACARRTCEVRSIDLGTTGTPGASRLLTRIPFRGGRPSIAVDRDTIAYSVQGGTANRPCDTIHVRAVKARTARTLDRGRCGTVEQLDLQDSRVAVLANTTIEFVVHTEARLLSTAGGRSRLLQREKESESRYAGANRIGAVSLDGGSLYTAVYGDEQPDRFSRFTLRTGARRDALAFVPLHGSYARDGGRSVYVTDPGGGSSLGFGCGVGGPPAPCEVVAGADPWATPSRLLPVALTLTTTPANGRVEVGERATVRALVTRDRVSRTKRLARVPQPGVAVDLLTATVRETGERDIWTLAATGRTERTDAAGRATFVADTTTVSDRTYTAQTRLAGSGLVLQAPTGVSVEAR